MSAHTLTAEAPRPAPLVDPLRVLDVAPWRKGAEQVGDVRLIPHSPVLGARVEGFRVAHLADAAVRQFLYDQLLNRGFLVFAPGSFAAADFVEVVKLFGSPQYLGTPHTPKSQVNRAMNTIDSRTKKTRANYIWHIDQAFQPEPTRFTALYGEVVPEAGGDTIFANAAAAYDLLDPLLATYLETLTAIQSFDAQGFLTYAYGHDAELLARQRAANPPIETPVIKTHPETGRKQIFVSELYTTRIVGVSPIASQALLSLLFDVIKSPEIQTRFRWEEGAAVIWDNRLVQHRGVGDFGTQHRLLHRAVVA
ncbi:TauD/TfdA dioxygenase family protein [Roseococcus pinisoli]|uniref:TauD/TfdA family dioxygenase n=1 Tax=Roseococcus pinisoli TaxID=2835040 RepID=A0ABS5QLD5_9PROT|nr:TauD/TfdA family dioxygenase [Roseococcus pinisoli]MBS7813603.1 TauD/TfdA family dioxygenase [Roseococcus pinisoli]